ncbi:MAG: adenosine kinase [Spirochaetes bacterium]|nr:adenosine kinase [Spirochaetota bacterium]
MNIKNTKAEYDVMGLGSALLDFTVMVDDGDLARLGLKKGEMLLIDADRSREILAGLAGKPMDITPGGSSANTLAGISVLGGKGIFLGSVGKDSHGDRYIEDTELIGVKAELGRHESMTGHAITFITPDSERTFATHLGAALLLSKDDVRESHVRNSKIIHIEGYLFEPPGLREASMAALEMAKKNDVLVSIDLSDPGLIGRIRPVFDQVIRDYADIIFVNEDEARSFTGKERIDALEELSRHCDFAVVKIGSEGSLIKTGGVVYLIPAKKTDVVNTNGAGDMYAAGVLYGLARGYTPERCGRIGSFVSSKVVSQVGARFPGKISVEAIA